MAPAQGRASGDFNYRRSHQLDREQFDEILPRFGQCLTVRPAKLTDCLNNL
jgi:hypothetical protein